MKQGPKRPSFAHRSPARGQRGVATLVVVMVLFFIISLVAAYTNRNLIFEQRTSVNQYRSTQALEAADAGMEWTVALLNAGRITTACTHSTDLTDSSFRDRYIQTNTTTGNMTAAPGLAGAALRAACVWNGAGWDCNCPKTGSPSLTAPTTAGIFPAFQVSFAAVGSPQPGVLRVLVTACTRLDICLNPSTDMLGEGRVTVSALVALTGNLASPPMAALVARGAVNAGGGMALTAYNTNPAANGITIQASGIVDTTGMVLRGLPGSPANQSVKDQDNALSAPALLPITADMRMFAAPFNMWPDSFQQQPAAVVLACASGTCSAASVRSAIALNPGRPLWIRGGLAIDSAGDIGTEELPALLVVNGDLSFPTSGVTLFGLVYVRNATWTTSGSATIKGSVIAQGNVAGNGAPTIIFDPDVLGRLRASVGSLVRVPGSWKDFQ